MAQNSMFTGSNWSDRIYLRENFHGDVLYGAYQYRDFQLMFGPGRFYLTDRIAQRMLEAGLTDKDGAAACEEGLQKYFAGNVGTDRRAVMKLFMGDPEARKNITGLLGMDSWTIQQIYGGVHEVHKQVFGADKLEEEKLRRVSTQGHEVPDDAVWQAGKKQQVLREKKAVVLALCEPEWAGEMAADAKEARANGLAVWAVAAKEPGGSLLSESALRELLGEDVKIVRGEEPYGDFAIDKVERNEALASLIEAGEAALIVYGETGFLQCRGLEVDSMVYGIPTVFASQVMVNQLGMYKPALVFVPARFDIAEHVRLNQRTRVCYWQLARLWEAHGDKIYGMTVSQLYREYPQYFLNVYENGKTCPEAQPDYPVQLRWPADFPADADEDQVVGAFMRLREEAVREYIQGEGITYKSGYFDKEFQWHEIPWESTTQLDGIAVQALSLEKAKKSKILHNGDETIRDRLAAEGLTDGIRYYSNFLFFMTENLIRHYNEQREDRPEEKLPVHRFHLDYMMENSAEKRVESFPLFRKSCMALKQDGSFLFFRFALRGGKVAVGGYPIAWEEADVNPETPGQVAVYTPQLSAGENEIETWEYKHLVGEGRVNLVFVRETLHCIRKGDVILPSVGVVVSLEEAMGEKLLADLGLTPNERGYCGTEGIEVSIHLQAPAGISEEEWAQVQWSYGGAMSLTLDGKDLFILGQDDSALEELSREGWMSPLSRQTQESQIHKLEKHPRTAVGCTKSGDFFVLVVSGRVPISSGADYAEVCAIAHKLFPDVQNMMNLDGGASSVLGMDVAGSFMELSYPSTTFGNCAGMTRPVYTALRLEK